MTALIAVVLAADPMACLPVPSEVQRYGDDAGAAYRDGVARDDPKAPRFLSAPPDSRLLLRLIWTLAGNKSPAKALRPLMDHQFSWSFGGDADADQAVSEWAKDASFGKSLRAAVAGACKATKSDVTCAAKKGPRLLLEKKEGCWRWTGFLSGD